METVNVTLEGVQGEPLGHVDTRVMDVTVTAAYTSAVVLADGTIIPPVIAEKILGSNGKTSFTVYGSDSSEVAELYRGFGVRFTARVRYARGQAGPTYQRTVKVPSGGPHDLGSLPVAEPFTPDEWKNIEDVAAPIRDAAESAALDASNAADAASASANSAQDAAAAAAAAENAKFLTQDEGVSTLIGNPVTDTATALQEKVASIAIGPRVDAFRLVTAGSDVTSEINSFLSDPTLVGRRRLIGHAQISGTVTIPDDTWLDAGRATIEQTAADTEAIQVGSRARISGLHVIGKGTDYVPSEGSSPQRKSGLILDGVSDVTIEDLHIERCAEAGIRGENSTGTRIYGYRFDGVDGTPDGSIGTIVIPDMDARCRAITMLSGCTDWTIDGLGVRDASMGMVTGPDCGGLILRGVRGRNIAGQHLCYIQSGDGLSVSDVQGHGIAYNVVKVQMTAAHLTDQRGITISGVLGKDIGGDVLIITHTSTNLSATPVFRGVAVANVTGENVGRLAFLQSIRGGTVTGLSGSNVQGEAVSIQNSRDLVVSDIALVDVGRAGIYIRGGEGGHSERVTVRGASIRNARPLNGPSSYTHGLYCDDGASVDLALEDITATGTLDYGGFFTGPTAATALPTTRSSGWRVEGAANASIRFVTKPSQVGGWSNMNLDKRVQNFPTTGPNYAYTTGEGRIYSASAPPASGNWFTGDRVENSSPTSGGVLGWVCVSSGTPGQWRSYGSISAS